MEPKQAVSSAQKINIQLEEFAKWVEKAEGMVSLRLAIPTDYKRKAFLRSDFHKNLRTYLKLLGLRVTISKISILKN